MGSSNEQARQIFEGTHGDLRRRLRVANVDLDTESNKGARYFFERQIISRDDAAAANQNNGATYREAMYNPALRASGERGRLEVGKRE